MEAWMLNDLLDRARSSGTDYYDVLRHDSMSCGIYRLPANGVDDQVPHYEDEIYIVMHGTGRLKVGEEDIAVGPGSLVFVAAHVDHRFYDFAEDLEILVLFAPAYTGRHLVE